MIISVSPRGYLDLNRPGQATNDLLTANFCSQVLDFELGAPSGLMENLGKKTYKSSEHTMAIDDPSRLFNRMQLSIEKSLSLGLDFSIAQAPFLRRDTKRKDLNNLLTRLAIESIKICASKNCDYIIVRPIIETLENSWDINREYYINLAKYTDQFIFGINYSIKF